MGVKGEYLSTGSTLLDLIVGGAPEVMGYPIGKFINIVGDKSAGKSFLCTELIAAAHHYFPKNKFRFVYDDCEAGFTFNTKEMYGFDIADDIANSSTVEEAYVNIFNFAKGLKSDQFGVYVLDSLDGLTSDEQDEQAADRVKAMNNGKSYDKGSYGMGKPKYLSREFFPQLCSVIQNKNILVIIVSQVRENIDPYSFEKYKRNGGKAMDFYAHTVLWLATLKKIVKKERTVGVVIRAKTTKSKTPRPFREGTFSLIFDYGVDNIGSNLDYLYELRTDKGELTAAAKAIAWGAGEIIKPTYFGVKKWLKEQTLPNEKNALEAFLKENEKANLDSILDFISKYDSLKDSYDSDLGTQAKTFTREALIRYIEEQGLEVELEKKVIAKWESLEKDISSQRKKRYATQPKGGSDGK